MSSSTTRQVGDYILTTAVPPPSKTKGRGSLQKTSEYPLADMKIGESFFKEAKDDDEAKKIAARVAAAWHWLRKANPNLHFQSAKYMSPHGVRVWRLADFTREELAEMKANKQKQKSRK
jgi:hypothetical protein